VTNHIFSRDGVEEILNLQPRGSKAKRHYVRQVRDVILRYKLASQGDGEEGDDDEEGRSAPLRDHPLLER